MAQPLEIFALAPRLLLEWERGSQLHAGLSGTEKSRIACSKIRGYYPVEADFIR